MGTLALPAPNAASMVNYLRSVNYQSTWRFFPGTSDKYEGPPPHGMLLTTYVNDTASAALTDRMGTLPVGSILVKENYMPDGVLDATTVMYKVAGYNPEHNDWFWTKILANGEIEAEGQVEGCQGCHGERKGNDYVWTVVP